MTSLLEVFAAVGVFVVLSHFMSPDVQLLVGVAGAFAIIATKLPAVESRLVSTGSWIKSSLSSLFSRSPTPADPVDADGAPIAQRMIKSPVDVHMTVTALMAYFSSQQDQKGLELCASVGAHVYECCVKQMGLPEGISTTLDAQNDSSIAVTKIESIDPVIKE